MGELSESQINSSNSRSYCGGAIRTEDANELLALRGSTTGGVQIVISDGLNVNALNENLRSGLTGPHALALE